MQPVVNKYGEVYASAGCLNFAMVLSYIEKFSPWIKEIYINQVDKIEDADDYDDEVHLSDVINNCFALTSLNIESSKIFSDWRQGISGANAHIH